MLGACEAPEMISDRRDVLQSLKDLAEGRPLPEVAGDCADPDVTRALLQIAARPDEYQEEVAQSSAQAILARMELAQVDAQIININAAITACMTSGDKSSYGVLARDISLLYARRERLRSLTLRRKTRP